MRVEKISARWLPGFFSGNVSTQHPNAQRLLEILVYGWLAGNVLWLVPVRDLLWGTDAVIARSGYDDGVLNNFFFQLVYTPHRAEVIFWIHLFTAIAGIFRFKFVFAPRLVCWATGLMLYYGAFNAFNSGFLLMLLLAFYLVFSKTNSLNPFRTILNNAIYLCCVLQIMMVYLAASLFKLTGVMWLNGDAIYYTLHIHRFSHDGIMQSGLLQNELLMRSLNYLALVYQMLFPVVVFLRHGRIPFLATGVLFHLFICVVMNLWDFGLAMIFAYAIFLPENFTGKVLQKTTIVNKG